MVLYDLWKKQESGEANIYIEEETATLAKKKKKKPK